MGQADRHRIELGEVLAAEFMRRQHLEHDGGERRLDARQGDLVSRLQILQRLDVGVIAVQPQRRGAEPADAHDFDVGDALGFGPQGYETGRANAGEIKRTGHHRVVDDIAAVQHQPVDLQLAKTGLRRLLLQELLILHPRQPSGSPQGW